MADLAVEFLANFTAGLALTTLAWRRLHTRRTPRQDDNPSP
ncbi:hypothetical protein ACFWWC_49855 [Streptomyces sp. NPDC058642]